MMKRIKTIAVMLVLLATWVRCASAQLPSETRKVFEEIVDQLDADLQKLFIKALDENSAVVEFTPEQFKRFRANAANPFEGLDKIDVKQLNGNIALKFELPTVRNRTSGALERQHPENLKKFSPVLQSWKQSICKIRVDGMVKSLGTIVSSEGYIVTKASELANAKKVSCVLANNKKFDGEVQAIDKTNDLAIIKVNAKELNPVVFAESTPIPGAFLVTGDIQGNAVAIGVCSTNPRALLSDTPAFLGLRPIDSPNGIKVANVSSPGAAENAGINAGDTILSIDGVKLTSANQLVNYIRRRKPNDKVVIEYQRGGTTNEAVAKLTGRTFADTGEKKLKQFGAILSRRSTGFPNVFQHDTPLLPEQCGGPVVDLEGKVVGINIARHGRVGSYALPSGHVKQILDKMLRRDVAAKPATNSSKN